MRIICISSHTCCTWICSTHEHTDTNTDTPWAEQGTDCPLPPLTHYIRAGGSFGSVHAVPPLTDSGSSKTSTIKVGRQAQEAAHWIAACALLSCGVLHALSCLAVMSARWESVMVLKTLCVYVVQLKIRYLRLLRWLLDNER